jgi:hypothetical protein
MAVDRTYVAQNGAERERLRALVGRLTDAELSRPMDAGWTVAAVLGHVAFWDQRALVVMEQWRKNPSATPSPGSEADVDWINDAGKPLLLAVPPRRAAELAVSIAEAVDRAAETLPDDLVQRNATAHAVNLLRATHRREHLDEIERLLGRR